MLLVACTSPSVLLVVSDEADTLQPPAGESAVRDEILRPGSSFGETATLGGDTEMWGALDENMDVVLHLKHAGVEHEFPSLRPLGFNPSGTVALACGTEPGVPVEAVFVIPLKTVLPILARTTMRDTVFCPPETSSNEVEWDEQYARFRVTNQIAGQVRTHSYTVDLTNGAAVNE